MDWDFDGLQRLIGQRIEAVALKQLRPRGQRAPSDDELVMSRLFLTLRDGTSLEFLINGLAHAGHVTERGSLRDIRRHLAQDGYEPVVEAVEDLDYPDGVQFTIYDSEIR